MYWNEQMKLNKINTYCAEVSFCRSIHPVSFKSSCINNWLLSYWALPQSSEQDQTILQLLTTSDAIEHYFYAESSWFLNLLITVSDIIADVFQSQKLLFRFKKFQSFYSHFFLGIFLYSRKWKKYKRSIYKTKDVFTVELVSSWFSSQ